MGLIEVLSDRCHFSDLVWFSVTKPLLCFSSLHKLPHACRQRRCKLPCLAIVAQITDHLQIQQKKKYYFHSPPMVASLSRTSPICTCTHQCSTWKKCATMSQSAKCCATIVPCGTQVTQNTARYELLLRAYAFIYGCKRSEGGWRGEVSYVKRLFMQNILHSDFTN